MLKTAENNQDSLFARAHQMGANGCLVQPPVAAVDLPLKARGDTLAAVKKTAAGQVISGDPVGQQHHSCLSMLLLITGAHHCLLPTVALHCPDHW